MIVLNTRNQNQGHQDNTHKYFQSYLYVDIYEVYTLQQQQLSEKQQLNHMYILQN